MLDVLHKGIYPAIAIAEAFISLLFSVYVYWNNNRLEREIRALKEQSQVGVAD
jgi:hypothetical protein